MAQNPHVLKARDALTAAGVEYTKAAIADGSLQRRLAGAS
jgi:hypothetical protein